MENGVWPRLCQEKPAVAVPSIGFTRVGRIPSWLMLQLGDSPALDKENRESPLLKGRPDE